jgi:hypothetical protein
MNRTWGGMELFEDSGDYEAFERILAEALDIRPGGLPDNSSKSDVRHSTRPVPMTTEP